MANADANDYVGFKYKRPSLKQYAPRMRKLFSIQWLILRVQLEHQKIIFSFAEKGKQNRCFLNV